VLPLYSSVLWALSSTKALWNWERVHCTFPCLQKSDVDHKMICNSLDFSFLPFYFKVFLYFWTFFHVFIGHFYFFWVLLDLFAHSLTGLVVLSNFFSHSTSVWIQGFALCRQMIYHLSHTFSPFLSFCNPLIYKFNDSKKSLTRWPSGTFFGSLSFQGFQI
jgi:hypothetical protein